MMMIYLVFCTVTCPRLLLMRSDPPEAQLCHRLVLPQVQLLRVLPEAENLV